VGKLCHVVLEKVTVLSLENCALDKGFSTCETVHTVAVKKVLWCE